MSLSVSRPTAARGFSLLEILVAFAIAGLALAMIYRVAGNNIRSVGGLDERERVFSLAQSLLAAYPLVPEQGLSEQGSRNGYTWTVSSHPYPTPINDAFPQAMHLQQLLIHVRGPQGQQMEVSSLRPELIEPLMQEGRAQP